MNDIDYTCGHIRRISPRDIVPMNCPDCGEGRLADARQLLWANDESSQKLGDGTLNTPTEAQLNDPKWWDENAPEWATHYVISHCVTPGGWYELKGAGGYKMFHNSEEYEFQIDNYNKVMLEVYPRPIKPKAERLAQHIAERDAFLAEDAEPQTEQESIADRIMELGNQVHNLGCEVQNDEALAGELEDIRGRLWDLGGQARKARERDQAVEAAKTVFDSVSESFPPILTTSLEKLFEALYDAGMLRKAGGE